MQGVKGVSKFLERVWNLQNIVTAEEGPSADLNASLHKTIKKVGEDIERMKFNTAIAALMSLLNEFTKKGSITRAEIRTMITLLNPFAPHMTEEMNERLGLGAQLATTAWPTYDESAIAEDTVEMAVQINGKVREKISVAADASNADVEAAVLGNEKVAALIAGKTVVKIIVIPGKLVNVVVR